MSNQISKTKNVKISVSFCFRLLRNFLDQKRKTVVFEGEGLYVINKEESYLSVLYEWNTYCFMSGYLLMIWKNEPNNGVRNWSYSIE